MKDKTNWAIETLRTIPKIRSRIQLAGFIVSVVLGAVTFLAAGVSLAGMALSFSVALVGLIAAQIPWDRVLDAVPSNYKGIIASILVLVVAVAVLGTVGGLLVFLWLCLNLPVKSV